MTINKRRKLVYGFGVNDSDYAVKDNNSGFTCPFYRKWAAMLERAYSPKYHKRFPTYKDCSVCEEWRSFMAFRAWMVKEDWTGKELDKDIIFYGNKEYSPDACCFVTRALNNLTSFPSANQGLPRGVSKRNDCDSFIASLCLGGKAKHIGSYSTVEEADKAYRETKAHVIMEAAFDQEGRVFLGLINTAAMLLDYRI